MIDILDDTIPEERSHGIDAGLVWRPHSEATVVYTDKGISPGMRYGIERTREDGRLVEYRTLDELVDGELYYAHVSKSEITMIKISDLAC